MKFIHQHYCTVCNICIAASDWVAHVSAHGDHIGHPFF